MTAFGSLSSGPQAVHLFNVLLLCLLCSLQFLGLGLEFAFMFDERVSFPQHTFFT